MKERPILFNGEMVRAILSSRKTQTRRVINPQPSSGVRKSVLVKSGVEDGHGRELVCPLGQPGDHLWVREAFRMAKSLDIHSPREVADLSMSAGYKNPWAPIQLEADGFRTGRWTGFDTPPVVTEPGKMRPSLHMPRWASRISLLITGICVERLDDISQHDARCEGIVDHHNVGQEKYLFSRLWRDIYGEESWSDNPWVWVIEFERVAAAGDQP